MDYITEVYYKYRKTEYGIELLCCQMAFVLYFDQRLGATNFKRWSNSAFSMFFEQKA